VATVATGLTLHDFLCWHVDPKLPKRSEKEAQGVVCARKCAIFRNNMSDR